MMYLVEVDQTRASGLKEEQLGQGLFWRQSRSAIFITTLSHRAKSIAHEKNGSVQQMAAQRHRVLCLDGC
jgi:hypothetical protein